MSSMVSGTQQVLRTCWLLEAVNAIRTSLKPWGKISDAGKEKRNKYY